MPPGGSSLEGTMPPHGNSLHSEASGSCCGEGPAGGPCSCALLGWGRAALPHLPKYSLPTALIALPSAAQSRCRGKGQPLTAYHRWHHRRCRARSSAAGGPPPSAVPFGEPGRCSPRQGSPRSRAAVSAAVGTGRCEERGGSRRHHRGVHLGRRTPSPVGAPLCISRRGLPECCC